MQNALLTRHSCSSGSKWPTSRGVHSAGLKAQTYRYLKGAIFQGKHPMQAQRKGSSCMPATLLSGCTASFSSSSGWLCFPAQAHPIWIAGRCTAPSGCKDSAVTYVKQTTSPGGWSVGQATATTQDPQHDARKPPVDAALSCAKWAHLLRLPNRSAAAPLPSRSSDPALPCLQKHQVVR